MFCDGIHYRQMKALKRKKKEEKKLNALDGICVILRVEWYLCLEFYMLDLWQSAFIK